MDREDVAELFSSYGPVSVRRMFSGFGLYADDVCFAMFLRGELFFKADATTIPRFEAEGAKPFSYTQPRSGKVVIVNSFWRLPERLYDEPDELADWTRAAVAVAHAVRMRKSRGKGKKVARSSAPARKKARVEKPNPRSKKKTGKKNKKKKM